MSYIKASVTRPAGNPGKGIKPRDLIVIYDVEDIAYFPERNDAGVVIEGSIVMKPGCYGVEIYMTPGTVEVTSASEGDPDAEGFTPSVKFNHPGNSQAIREFKANYTGRNLIVAVRHCSGQPTDVVGSPCNPVRLTTSYTGNNEQNTNEMTLTQVMKGDDVAIYNGTLPLAEPVATVQGGLTHFPYAGEGQYQLSPGEASIETIDGGVHGAVITLLGASTVTSASPVSQQGESSGQTTGSMAAPVVESGGSFLLKDGASWIGGDGAQLTLRAFSYKDAAASMLMWIEQSRYEP